jgi:hypothetical protein
MGGGQPRAVHRAVLVAVGVGLTIGACTAATVPSQRPAREPGIDLDPSAVREIVEDVAGATASRFGAHDDRGHEMDTVKVLQVSDGRFVGLYHAGDAVTLDVHLATSTDLIDWTWQITLAQRASMPTITPASDGGYVVAWEQEPDNHLRFALYPTDADLLAGRAARTFDAPQTLSDCAEGTPNLYAASSTYLDVGFHFYDDCDVDRQARGTGDWSSWTAAPRPGLEDAVRANGVRAGVGDRDVIIADGTELTLIEGMKIRDQWPTWRIYLHDASTGRAERLAIRTPAGSTAFTNPTISPVTIDGRPALFMSLFVPHEANPDEEAGALIYYRTYDPAPD